MDVVPVVLVVVSEAAMEEEALKVEKRLEVRFEVTCNTGSAH